MGKNGKGTKSKESLQPRELLEKWIEKRKKKIRDPGFIFDHRYPGLEEIGTKIFGAESHFLAEANPRLQVIRNFLNPRNNFGLSHSKLDLRNFLPVISKGGELHPAVNEMLFPFPGKPESGKQVLVYASPSGNDVQFAAFVLVPFGEGDSEFGLYHHVHGAYSPGEFAKAVVDLHFENSQKDFIGAVPNDFLHSTHQAINN